MNRVESRVPVPPGDAPGQLGDLPAAPAGFRVVFREESAARPPRQADEPACGQAGRGRERVRDGRGGTARTRRADVRDLYRFRYVTDWPTGVVFPEERGTVDQVTSLSRWFLRT